MARYRLPGEATALQPVQKNFGEAVGKQLFFRIVAEHTNERGIHVENAIVGGDNVDAFLESFEEFGEAGFVFARGGDIASKNRDAVNFVAAHHGVGDAVVVEGRRVTLDPDVNDAGPVAALDEARHGAINQSAPSPLASSMNSLMWRPTIC